MAHAAESLAAAILADLSVERGWRLIERFATLVRQSGSPDEHAAAAVLAGELDELGIDYEVWWPGLRGRDVDGRGRRPLPRRHRRPHRPASRAPAAFDTALKELARILVPINYARGGRFTHDPALALGVLPALDDAGKVTLYREQRPERLPFLLAGLRRQVNRVAHAFAAAARVARRAPHSRA